MNRATASGLYAAISNELDGNLMFPGSETFYILFDSFTYSRVHGQFSLWAAMEPKCGNQAFNVVNGDTCGLSSRSPSAAIPPATNSQSMWARIQTA